MSVITTQPILMHLRDRLRANYVDASLYNDPDLLLLLSDAYQEACERSAVLEALTTISVVPPTVEYALPADCSQVLLVYLDGRQLDGVGQDAALGDLAAPAYYRIGERTIGFALVDQTATQTARILYAQRPSAFATYADTLDPRFPEEYADILVHHVRYRVQMLSGGAERIPQAQGDRQVAAARIKALREQAIRLDGVGSSSFASIQRPATSDLRMLRAR